MAPFAPPRTGIVQAQGLTIVYDFGTSYSGVAVKALGPDPLLLGEFPQQA